MCLSISRSFVVHKILNAITWKWSYPKGWSPFPYGRTIVRKLSLPIFKWIRINYAYFRQLNAQSLHSVSFKAMGFFASPNDFFYWRPISIVSYRSMVVFETHCEYMRCQSQRSMWPSITVHSMCILRRYITSMDKYRAQCSHCTSIASIHIS